MKSCLKTSAEHYDEGEPNTQPKTVNFGRLEFREYPIIMGANPSVSEGVPVTIDWDHFGEYDVDIESYEIAANKAEVVTAGSRCPRLDVTRRAQL